MLQIKYLLRTLCVSLLGRYSIARNAASAKQEPEFLGEEILEKLNEIPVVEEASIHIISFVSDGDLVFPNAYVIPFHHCLFVTSCAVTLETAPIFSLSS